MSHHVYIITKTKEHIHLIRMMEIIYNGKKIHKPQLEIKHFYVIETTTTSLMNEKKTIDLKQMQ